MGEHDAARGAGRPRRGEHEGVTGLDGPAAVEGGALARGIDDRARGEGGDRRPAGGGREPRVERGGGVTGVPDPPQGIDEGRSAGEVECDELGHPPVA